MIINTPRKSIPVDPLISYFGGKQGLLDDLLPLFPAHRIYVDVFAGSGSVLEGKTPSSVEVYNDADPHVVNLHKVAQIPADAELLRLQLLLTPNSRREHSYCKEHPVVTDPIETARRYVVRVRQSYSSILDGCWGSSRTTPGNHFKIAAHRVRSVGQRLRTVKIENRHFRDLLPVYDAPDTLWYMDPPYLPETRVSPDVYGVEMTAEEHEELLQLAVKLSGFVVISGYGSDLYDRTLVGWHRREKVVSCSTSPADRQGKSRKPKRTEVIWFNPAVKAALLAGTTAPMAEMAVAA